MSNPDQPHNRGAWPTTSARGGDRALSSADGWPSLGEWRNRPRASDTESGDVTGSGSSAEALGMPGSPPPAPGRFRPADDGPARDGEGVPDAHAKPGQGTTGSPPPQSGGSGARDGGPADPSAPGHGGGWHSEVLAGSSWFADDQADGGERRSGRGRRSSKAGRSGRRGDRRAKGWLPEGPEAESPAGADPESVARAICLRLLTMAPKTRAQLAEALRKREVPDDAAEAVLSRFSELGLIDDEAFAAAWVDSRHHGRGLAKRALAAELRHRGVDTDTVNEAVDRLDPDQEAETARRLVERKLAATRSLDPRARTRRLAGMLARKGYSSGLAFRVIREALEQEGIDMEEDFP
ncbi:MULTISPECIES: recombination regulator RecX [unclassified Nonomuraea]|uniref:recombination regulator RecX n=1 Tax=unclassified Nonomuraea TaxID=2593643 RepID=UPI001F019E17|nr:MULTISPECIES: recombination regulator RecX [unclassified Nonomuraea]